jgi:hypothetical protein
MKEEQTPAPHVDVERVYGRNFQQTQPHSEVPAASPDKVERGKYRKYFFYVLIGGVVISALISIVAVLIGGLNDYISRALLTTLLMVIHAMIALAFISSTTTKRTIGQEIVTNTLLTIVIASFFTSTLGIWQVISGETAGDFYQLYAYGFIAALIVQMLLSVNVIDKTTNLLMRTSVGITVFMWAYLIPSVFDNGYVKSWPEIYYRGIAAIGILLGTVLVLVTIFHRLYVSKHPELIKEKQAAARHKGMPGWLIVVLCVFGIPIALGYLGSIISMLFSVFSR